MILKAKLILSVLLLSILTVSTSSCSNEQKDANIEQKNASPALSEAQPVKDEVTTSKPTHGVYQVLSVDPRNSPNKMRDFLWMENNEKKLFSEYTKDKVVFLNFWATWCGPCRHEIPAIIEISKELDPKEFVVVGIFLERDRYQNASEAIKRVENFAVSKGINYINFNPTQELEIAVGQISGIPTTFIIDKEGTIKEKIVGARSKSDFLTSIKKVMGK